MLLKSRYSEIKLLHFMCYVSTQTFNISENANELYFSTRASLKHGMVYKTRKNSGGML